MDQFYIIAEDGSILPQSLDLLLYRMDLLAGLNLQGSPGVYHFPGELDQLMVCYFMVFYTLVVDNDVCIQRSSCKFTFLKTLLATMLLEMPFSS